MVVHIVVLQSPQLLPAQRVFFLSSLADLLVADLQRDGKMGLVYRVVVVWSQQVKRQWLFQIKYIGDIRSIRQRWLKQHLN